MYIWSWPFQRLLREELVYSVTLSPERRDWRHWLQLAARWPLLPLAYRNIYQCHITSVLSYARRSISAKKYDVLSVVYSRGRTNSLMTGAIIHVQLFQRCHPKLLRNPASSQNKVPGDDKIPNTAFPLKIWISAPPPA